MKCCTGKAITSTHFINHRAHRCNSVSSQKLVQYFKKKGTYIRKYVNNEEGSYAKKENFPVKEKMTI